MKCEFRELSGVERLARASGPIPPILFVGPIPRCINCIVEQFAALLNGEPHDAWRYFKHADMTVLKPERGIIAVDKIREFCRQESRKSFSSGTKVMLILQAELLTIEAQNALLKTLEEPSPSTVILLTASSKSLLTDTIISRCNVVEIPVLRVEDLVKVFSNRLPIDDLTLLRHYGRLASESPSEDIQKIRMIEARIHPVLDNIASTAPSNLIAQFESVDLEELLPAVTRWVLLRGRHTARVFSAVEVASRLVKTSANRSILSTGLALELRDALK